MEVTPSTFARLSRFGSKWRGTFGIGSVVLCLHMSRPFVYTGVIEKVSRCHLQVRIGLMPYNSEYSMSRTFPTDPDVFINVDIDQVVPYPKGRVSGNMIVFDKTLLAVVTYLLDVYDRVRARYEIAYALCSMKDQRV